MPDRLIVILNAASGDPGKEEIASRLVELFRARDTEATVLLARDGEEIVEMARRAVLEKPRAIIAGGGDGTVNAVASMLVGTNIALGVLALGTLNHFARDMRIPSDLDEAAHTIVAGHVTAVDVGEVNERIFVNNSSLGLYPSLVRRRQRQQQKLGRGKWPAFAWAAFTVLRRYAFMRVHLRANGNNIIRRTPFVFIGNNQYEMEGLHIGARECLNRGQLCLFMPHHGGRLGLLGLALRALFRRLRGTKDFDELVAEAMVVETHQKRPHVAVDGEVTRMDAPLRYRVRPGALRVIVPEPAPTSEASAK
jgi:diacylglycerol kinase family enzyme